jgi:hypothetical protein
MREAEGAWCTSGVSNGDLVDISRPRLSNTRPIALQVERARHCLQNGQAFAGFGCVALAPIPGPRLAVALQRLESLAVQTGFDQGVGDEPYPGAGFDAASSS